jgi:hypothetical protein
MEAVPPFAKRYQGVRDPLRNSDELAKLLRSVLDLDSKTTSALIEEPFVGLRAMREEESNLFFGRKAEIAALVEKFLKHRVVAIVADSGTGKSSLARAGFAPAFRGGILIDPVREETRDKIWQVVTMRSRADPAEGLWQGVEGAAQKLRRSLADVGTLRDSVSMADTGKTAFALRCGLPPDKTSTLLIVDQFEELFTATSDKDAADFSALLLALADGPVAERGRGSPPTSAMTTPICSARSVRLAAPGPPWRCPMPTPTWCSFTSTKSRATSLRAPMPFCCSTGLDGTQPASSTCPTTSRRSSCTPVPRS